MLHIWQYLRDIIDWSNIWKQRQSQIQSSELKDLSNRMNNCANTSINWLFDAFDWRNRWNEYDKSMIYRIKWNNTTSLSFSYRIDLCIIRTMQSYDHTSRFSFLKILWCSVFDFWLLEHLLIIERSSVSTSSSLCLP